MWVAAFLFSSLVETLKQSWALSKLALMSVVKSIQIGEVGLAPWLALTSLA